MNKLEINLVPADLHFVNLRAYFSKQEWDIIRKKVYDRAHHKCEICGGVCKTHRVEAHEEWSYDTETRLATLERLTALCPSCHEVKHFGFAVVSGHEDRALAHLCKINNLSVEEGEEQVQAAFAKWDERNEIHWKGIAIPSFEQACELIKENKI
jgi:hypothetical protein